MNRKLLIQSVGFVIVAMVLLPSTAIAAAASPQDVGGQAGGGQNGVIDQILPLIKNIQKMMDTVLTKLTAIQSSVNRISTNLTSLQTDVATIKTTTNTINDKVNAPPEPIRYEYYTTVMPSRFLNAYDGTPVVSPIVYWIGFSNGGDTAAEVTYTIYTTTNIVSNGIDASSEMTVIENDNLIINEKHSKSHLYIANANPDWDPNNISPLRFPILTFKIISNSPFVAPRLLILDSSGRTVDEYSPGDFQRVEIYS